LEARLIAVDEKLAQLEELNIFWRDNIHYLIPNFVSTTNPHKQTANSKHKAKINLRSVCGTTFYEYLQVEQSEE